MFFLIILGSMFLGDVLWCSRALLFLRHRRPRWVGWVALAFGLVQFAVLIGLATLRGGLAAWAEAVPRPVYDAVFVWHLLLLPLWLVLQAGRGLSALARWIARVRRRPAPAAGGLTRREFLSAAATFTPPLLSLGGALAGERELDQFRVRRLAVPVPHLPPALEGLTIAQVTDVHVGRFTRGRILERIVEETNRLDADIVALTGDLVNDSLRALPAGLEMVRALRARHLVVSCEGNHDLIEDPARFHREAERGGLPLLRNSTASVTVRGQRLQFLGLPWGHGPDAIRADMQRLLAQRDAAAWPVLLAHHPHAWDAAEDIPLTLSGHTHGGQIMFTPQVGFGPWLFRYWSGLYTRPGRSLVVSNGVGNWFPLRLNAPAEILHLTLQAATS